MAAIEHSAIYANDAPALRDYFIDTFGMRLILDNGTEPPGYFLADDRGQAIEIIGRAPGKTNEPQRWVCHLAFWVDDFAAAKARLESRGAVFETETLVDNDNIKTGFFNDPEGNRLQIVWRKTPLSR